jgi:hypothetical protein
MIQNRKLWFDSELTRLNTHLNSLNNNLKSTISTQLRTGKIITISVREYYGINSDECITLTKHFINCIKLTRAEITKFTHNFS